MDSTASENRLRLQHHAFAAAERPVVHGLVPVVGPIAQIVDADFESPAVAAPASPRRARTAPRKTRGRSSAHGKSRVGSIPSILRAIPPRCAGRRDRSPRRSSARTESVKPPSTTSSPRRRHPPSRDAAQSARRVRALHHFAARPGPTGKIRPVRAARARRTERALPRPPSARRREMVSTPRNLKISVPSWNQVDSTSSARHRRPSPAEQIHFAAVPA